MFFNTYIITKRRMKGNMLRRYSSAPNKRPHFYQFGKFVTQKLSNFDVKSVISWHVTILYLDFVVKITSHVQTLILDF